MRRHLLSILLLSCSFFGHCQSEPALKGPVTRFTSIRDFDVSGRRILLDPGARVYVKTPDGAAVTASDSTRVYLGESVSVFGTEPWSKHGLRAQRVEMLPAATHPVEGVAIIEAVIPGAVNEVRADGYRIRIGSGAQSKYEKPMGSFADVGAGMVVSYKGRMQADGVVEVESVTFAKNEIPKSLTKLRADWEFDPDAVPADSRQSGTDKFVRGRDPSYFPRYRDAAMEARVSAIGAKLVPEYQRKMDVSDPARIDFRFYVVDAPKATYAYPLPSGIVLVPYQMVRRMENDSQLAAVLGDAVARLVEEQPLPLPLTNGQLAQIAGIQAAQMIPIAGLGVSGYLLTEDISAIKWARRNDEQRARVSLELMQEAGFDVLEAPRAWWVLSVKEAKQMAEKEPPPHAVYLYSVLAEVQAGRAGELVSRGRQGAVG